MRKRTRQRDYAIIPLLTYLNRCILYDIIDLNKAFGLPEQIDPNHKYIYRSGSNGIYAYWWKDVAGNYWKYTNAPEDHIDHDPLAGNPLIDPEQPTPSEAPAFFTEEGYKRNVAVPQDVQVERNPSYNPQDPANVWLEKYTDQNGVTRYVYRDTDVRENLDLWVQQQLRIADAALLPFRGYAVNLFNSSSDKDKVIAAILMLVDQAHYDPTELINATVGDLEFTDVTAKLLGRKFLCDVPFLDYLSTLKSGKDPASPLFEITTRAGKNPVGTRHLYSLFYALKVPPEQLIYLHANQIFSRIVHRMLSEDVPVDQVTELAMQELSRVFTSSGNVQYLVDPKVKKTLISNYANQKAQRPDLQAETGVEKSLNVAPSDDFGVAFVYSSLSNRRPDELEFSTWLHAEPLHQISDAEESQLQEQLSGVVPEEDTNESIIGDEGAVAGGNKNENDVSDASAAKGGDNESNPSDEGAVAGGQ